MELTEGAELRGACGGPPQSSRPAQLTPPAKQGAWQNKARAKRSIYPSPQGALWLPVGHVLLRRAGRFALIAMYWPWIVPNAFDA